MSDGTATHEDMLEIVQLAQDEVEKKFAVKLENEVQIITSASGVAL